MNCPNCDVPLVISERQQVEIDYCPRCRGVWLDRGELDKILDRAAPVQGRVEGEQRRDRDNDRDRDDYQPHKKKKREGFLGELFDF